MKKPVQQNRQIAIATPLGANVLVLNRATIHERLNALFSVEAELSSVDGNLDYRKIVGRPAVLRLELGSPGTRWFHGHVSRFVQTSNQGGYARYRATIVPWLWYLTRTSDCRVFQRKTVLEIAEDVFNFHRFGSELYDIRLGESYPARRYCVQYRETDCNFVNRLLEAEGIGYWFEHEQDRHRLVLADSIQASVARPGYETLDYHEVEAPSPGGREVVTDWIVAQEVEPVGCVLKDYDFKKPSDPLLATHEIRREHGMARFKIYDYPGEYYEPGDAERYARLRIEELQAGHEVIQGTTTARGLAAGQVFELANHPRADQNRKYLVTELTMTLDAGEFASGGTGDEYFRCSFRAIPSTTPFRPPRVTPKPIVQGIQTATVVGEKGKEVDPDEFGRVKVQFHWDRYGSRDENSSCWVRVTQPWAGKGFGCMNIPRIGQEVVVEFIEGDPDRPLINGRLYNAENMPNASNAGRKTAGPPNLQAAAMMTSFKSNSLGGSGGSNEITMNDAGGAEGLFIKAQKDEIHTVGNDREDTVVNNETRKVGNDRSREVANNETISIGVNRDKTVGSNETENIGANKTITVGANHTEQIGANMSLTVGANQSVTVGANKTETVAIASAETVGAAKALTVGAAYQVSVGGLMNETVGAAKMVQVALSSSETVGQTSSLKAKKVTITADDEIAIKVGSAQITMKKSGDISIKGTNIKIKGTKIEAN